MTNALLLRRRGMMATKTLPYDAEIEYLQSTGTQFINTQIALNSKTFRVDADVAFGSSTTYQNIVGAHQTSGSRYSLPLGVNNTGRPYIQIGDGNSYIYSVQNVDYRDGVIRNYVTRGDGSRIYITVGGQTANKTITGSLSTYNMYLFGRNRDNALVNALVGKIKRISIEIANIIVRDFIPVRVGTVGYMYDRVSGQLFGNDGTGDFILGPDVI